MTRQAKPADFDVQCVSRSIPELEVLYGASWRAVTAWLLEVPFHIIAERRMNMIERYEASRNYVPGKRGWQTKEAMAEMTAVSTLSEMG